VVSAHTLMDSQKVGPRTKPAFSFIFSDRFPGARIVIEKDSLLSAESVGGMQDCELVDGNRASLQFFSSRSVSQLFDAMNQ
jgi:hypothetical protein